MAESQTVMTRLRIFDTHLMRTIMRKETGELYETFPNFSRTKPFASFAVGGWDSKAPRGERSFNRILGLTRLILFHTKYGMLSGPPRRRGRICSAGVASHHS